MSCFFSSILLFKSIFNRIINAFTFCFMTFYKNICNVNYFLFLKNRLILFYFSNFNFIHLFFNIFFIFLFSKFFFIHSLQCMPPDYTEEEWPTIKQSDLSRLEAEIKYIKTGVMPLSLINQINKEEWDHLDYYREIFLQKTKYNIFPKTYNNNYVNDFFHKQFNFDKKYMTETFADLTKLEDYLAKYPSDKTFGIRYLILYFNEFKLNVDNTILNDNNELDIIYQEGMKKVFTEIFYTLCDGDVNKFYATIKQLELVARTTQDPLAKHTLAYIGSLLYSNDLNYSAIENMFDYDLNIYARYIKDSANPIGIKFYSLDFSSYDQSTIDLLTRYKDIYHGYYFSSSINNNVTP